MKEHDIKQKQNKTRGQKIKFVHKYDIPIYESEVFVAHKSKNSNTTKYERHITTFLQKHL